MTKQEVTREILEKNGIRICIGVPMERTVPGDVFPHFWAIAQRGYSLVIQDYTRTDVARNRLAQTLLESDFTHILMLDLDHRHPDDIVERHGRWLLSDPEKKVIAGLHFRRAEPYDPCAYVFGPDLELHPLAMWPQGLIQVHALGHGSLLIHRSVFETIPKPWWAYDYSRVEEDIYPTEDLYFCYLCRTHGIDLWVDTTTTSPHLIVEGVEEDDYRTWLSLHPEKVVG